jgi:hypothetical protein
VLEANEQEDDGQIAHDGEVIKSIQDLAIYEMRERGVCMTSAEEKEALKLFPVVFFKIYCLSSLLMYFQRFLGLLSI